MSRFQLISMRMDKRILAQIDEFLTKHPYWTRSGVINYILLQVLHDFDPDQLYDLVSGTCCREFDMKHVMSIYRDED